MPALLLHLTLAERTLAHAGAPAAVTAAARGDPGAFLLGSILPDLPYHARFGRQLLRHFSKRPYLHSEWGDIFHTRRTGHLALALLCHLDRSFPGEAERVRLLALCAGYLSHHAVDRVAHPFIQARVAALVSGGAAEHHQVLHSRIERHQSLIYHHDLLGYDIAGSPYPHQLIGRMSGAGLLGPTLDPCLFAGLRAACLQTHGRSPAGREVSDWLFGVTAYGVLLSSPAGRTERLEGELQALRTAWYSGPEVDLATPLSRAMDLTVDCWQAALELLAAARITTEVRRVFLARVPDLDLGTGA